MCDMLRILYFRKPTLAVVWIKQKLGMAGYETLVYLSGKEATGRSHSIVSEDLYFVCFSAEV